MTREEIEALLDDRLTQMWDSNHQGRETRMVRVARRSQMFLTELERQSGRPEVDPEDKVLSLAILDAAARAGLEQPELTEAPEWACKAFYILRKMSSNLPETVARRFMIQTKFEEQFPGKVGPLHESDPVLYLCQIQARNFFFTFGMPEAEHLLACCLVAYSDGWLPSSAEWKDLPLPMDYEQVALVQDLNSQLAKKSLREAGTIRHTASVLKISGVAFGALVVAAAILGAPALGLLFTTLFVSALVGSRVARKKANRLEGESLAFAEKAGPRPSAYPRILPHTIPAPPPCFRCKKMSPDCGCVKMSKADYHAEREPRVIAQTVEGPPCVMCGETLFANATTKPGAVLYGCTGCGQMSG
jgi:hypothetical protein